MNHFNLIRASLDTEFAIKMPLVGGVLKFSEMEYVTTLLPVKVKIMLAILRNI